MHCLNYYGLPLSSTPATAEKSKVDTKEMTTINGTTRLRAAMIRCLDEVFRQNIVNEILSSDMEKTQTRLFDK